MENVVIVFASIFSISFLILTYLVFSIPLAQTPEFGARGLARKQAKEAKIFGVYEVVLRLFAAHVARFPVDTLRNRLDKILVEAGEMRGMTPDEVIVVSIFFAGLGVTFGSYLYIGLGSMLGMAIFVLLCPWLPLFHLRRRALLRRKSIVRNLPVAIDLASLCMSAGLDFPGAISHVVKNMIDSNSPLREELLRLLRELSLGRTRKDALQEFANRIQSGAIREFVAAVIQAESRGTPISQVLSTQASFLREKRSVLVEEAAARAGVLLILPMLLLMISITLLLFGPLLLEMMEGGLM